MSIKHLVKELKRVQRDPSPESEMKASELADQIAKGISKKVLNKALEHPAEIRNLINPLDVNSHPVLH